MALFQKKPQVSESIPLYSLGLEKNILIVGLGNKGAEYDGTRHNIGFEGADALVKSADLPDWVDKKDLKCRLSMGTLGDTRVIVIKPQTYMNLSGEAVQATMRFYKIPLEQVLVIHDELDLPFGQIRTRVGGGSAGHNGIKSIIQHCGDGFGRVRIGIKAETSIEDSADFVLAKFTKDEQAQLPHLTKEVTSLLTEYIYSGQLPHETRNFIV